MKHFKYYFEIKKKDQITLKYYVNNILLYGVKKVFITEKVIYISGWLFKEPYVLKLSKNDGLRYDMISNSSSAS